MTTAAAAGVMVGVPGPVPTVPVSLTLKYTCAFPVIGDRSMSVDVRADIPAAAVVGVPSPKFAVRALATIDDATVTGGLGMIGVATVEGTATATGGVTAPQGTVGFTVPLTIARAVVPGSGPIKIPAAGTAPALAFSRPGPAKITIGSLALHLVPKNASGSETMLGEVDVTCGLEAGQNDVLDSFDITQPSSRTTATPGSGPSSGSGPGSSPGSSSSSTVSAATAATTTAPAAATAAPTPTTAFTDAPAAASADTGTSDDRGALELALLAATVLVAGAAFGVVSRRKRRTGGNS